jgi:DNA-binding NarL/FixJ family response regulator
MAKTLKVLIIEDDAVDRKFLARALENDINNFDVCEAGDCATAIETIKQTKVDCILLDYNLPDGDGHTLLPKLLEINIEAPIIFVTGRDDEAFAALAIKSGASGYVLKEGLSPKLLLHNIKKSFQINDLRMRSIKTQFELEESESQYQAIVERIAEIYFRLDVDKKISYASPATLKFLGFSNQELIGKPIVDLIEEGGHVVKLLELGTRRFGDRATTGLEIILKTKIKLDPDKSEIRLKIKLDSFGRWNLPHTEFPEEIGGKEFLCTLCIGKIVERLN